MTNNNSIISTPVVTAKYDDDGNRMQQVLSFVRRKGRLTLNQQQALDGYWGQFGVDYRAQSIDFKEIFQLEQPIILEIGFGMGHSLISMAQQQPNQNYLGIEVYLPGVGSALTLMQQNKLKNIKVMCHDAVEVLQYCIPDSSLQRVQLFFPDPWHKKRHNKRRLVKDVFIELLAKKLKQGGIFHMATDWQPYADQVIGTMRPFTQFKNLSPTQNYVTRPEFRPLTKFEKRGARLGHGVWDMMFERI